MTKTERILISNQLRTLEALYPDEAADHRRFRKVVEEGYVAHYGDYAQHISNEVSPEVTREVLDVLQMYSDLLFAWRELEDKHGLTERNVSFPGFDGNYETDQLVYCEYFLNDLGRFEQHHRGSYNSHARMLPRYREQIGRWKHVKTAARLRQFTAEEIKTILGIDA